MHTSNFVPLKGYSTHAHDFLRSKLFCNVITAYLNGSQILTQSDFHSNMRYKELVMVVKQKDDRE